MGISRWLHQPQYTFNAVERYLAIFKPFSSNLRLNEENIKKQFSHYLDFKQSLRLSGIFPSRIESKNVVYFLRWTVGLGTNLSEQYLLSILDQYSVLRNRERIK